MESDEGAAKGAGVAVMDQCILDSIEHLLYKHMEESSRRFEQQQATMMGNIEFYLKHVLEILERFTPDEQTVELGLSLTRDRATSDGSSVSELHSERQQDAPPPRYRAASDGSSVSELLSEQQQDAPPPRDRATWDSSSVSELHAEQQDDASPQRSVHLSQAAGASEDIWETDYEQNRQERITSASAGSRGGSLSSQASVCWQTLEPKDRVDPPFTSLHSAIEAAKCRDFSRPQSSFFGSSRRKHLGVYQLDRLNMDGLIEMERRTYEGNSGHGRRRNPVPSYPSELSESSFVPNAPVDSPRRSGDVHPLSDPNQWSNMVNTVSGVDADIPSESNPALRDMADREGGRRRTTSQMPLDKVRREQEEAIISAYALDRSGETVEESPFWFRWHHLVFKLSGVLPFGVCKSTVDCGPLVCLLCGLMLLYSLYTFYIESDSSLSIVCVCYASGGGLGLYLLRRTGIHSVIGTSETLLEQYAIRHGFFDDWMSASSHQLILVGAFWIVAVVCMSFIVLSMPNEDDTEGFISSMVGLAASFIFSSGVVMALTYCQVHVCVGLELMVDTFCVDFLGEKKFEKGVLQWNTMQAVMRRAAQAVDLCFLVVQTFGLTATILIFMDSVMGSGSLGRSLPSLLPSLAMMAMMHFAQYRAAAVTQRCLQAPALVNSLAFDGNGINAERQYMVQFITQSAAGFYVRGVRLTPLMVLKVAYFCVVVTFSLAMRFSKFASKSPLF